jgi:hypothetical protein
VQELLGEVVVRLTRHREQVGDVHGHLLLLLEREADRRDVVRELRLRRADLGEVDPLVAVEQVVDHLHRVLALFLGLVVEELGELRVRLGRVVGPDRRVLVRRGELTRDLGVQGVDEALGGGHVGRR